MTTGPPSDPPASASPADSGGGAGKGPRPRRFWLSIAGGMVVALVAAFLHWGFSVIEAVGDEGGRDPGYPVEYRGRLFAWDGRPLADAEFRLYLPSAGGRRVADKPLTFATDGEGRYCLRGTSTYGGPFLEVPSVESDAAVDPRFASGRGRQMIELRESRLLPGTRLTVGFALQQSGDVINLMAPPDNPPPSEESPYWLGSLESWEEASDATDDCQPIGMPGPWYNNFWDPRRPWRFWTPIVLPLGAAALLVMAAVAARVKGSAAVLPRRLRALGLWAVAADVVLFLILWDIV